MAKTKYKLTAIIAILSMLCLFLPVTSGTAASGTSSSIQIGDYLQMGTYYDEPILWRCVDIDENGPLMLSDKILCLKPFDAQTSENSETGSHSRDSDSNRASYGSNYWADSNMRSWLNSSATAGNVEWLCGNPPIAAKVPDGYNAYDSESGFLTNFTAKELKVVKEVTQKSLLNENDSSLATSGTEIHTYNGSISGVVQNYDKAYSENVTDKMFLLDVKQLNAVYNNGDVLDSDYYIGRPTEKCVENSDYTSNDLTVGSKWYYWLRSPYSGYKSGVRYVYSSGDVNRCYAYVGYIGVRPAFYLDVSTFTAENGEGTAAKPYTIDGASTPTATPTPSCVMQEPTKEPTPSPNLSGFAKITAEVEADSYEVGSTIKITYAYEGLDEKNCNVCELQMRQPLDSKYFEYVGCTGYMGVSGYNRVTGSFVTDFIAPSYEEYITGTTHKIATIELKLLKTIDGKYKMPAIIDKFITCWDENYNTYEYTDIGVPTIVFELSILSTPTPTPNNSGVSGGVTWRIDGDTLYLSGGGSMNDYTKGGAPWYKQGSTQVKKIVFEDNNITTVGAYAFYGFGKLTSVEWSENADLIGKGAFEDCSALVGVQLPQRLISIADDGFKGCAVLKSIAVPGGVSLMGAGAFEGCTALAEITLPFIGAQVGSKDSKTVFSYIFGGNVPASLKKVTITNETNVPENAFKGCADIENISVNSEVKTIGASAFDGCKKLKIFAVPEGIKVIGDCAFRNCESAATIRVPNTVTSIGESAFDGCRKLTSVNVPDKVEYIYNYTFRNCASLEKITIPTTVKTVGVSVLEGCNKLYDIKVPFVGANADPGAESAGENGIFGYFFGAADNRDVPPSVTKVEVISADGRGYIPMAAFKDCIYIEDIIITGERNILDGAFENCRNLRNLYIPSSVSTIGKEILKDCTQLETLVVPFIGITNISGSINSRDESSVLGGFFGYNDRVKTGTLQYYDRDGNGFHYYKVPPTLKKISLLNQVEIPEGAFMNCDFIENVSIVTGAVMHKYAFYNCKSLVNVTLPIDMQTIETQAFALCESLESINIPAKVKTIGEQVFYNARNLKNVTMPDSVTEIADDVFNGTNLQTMSEIGLMSDSLTITCSEGSEAQKYADAKGIATNIVSKDKVNIRETATTVSLLSDNSYLFDVINAYTMRGTLHIELYDENGRMISEKTQDTETDVEYRAEFSQEEMSGVSSAKVYIADDSGKMISTAEETMSLENGEIPELPENDIEIVYDSDSGSVSFTGTAAVYMKKGAVLIVAVYNNSDGSLYEVKLYDISGIDDEENIDTAFDGKKVKLMLWESMENTKPLAEIKGI